MPTETLASEPADPGGSETPSTGSDRRLLWLAGAALFLALSTVVALRQEPRGDPYAARDANFASWFLHPIEKNPEQRLPVVAGEIRDVWASSDGTRMWAVGSGGLALRRDAGDGSWERVELTRRRAGTEGGAQAHQGEGRDVAPTEELERGAQNVTRWRLPGGDALAQAAPSRAERSAEKRDVAAEAQGPDPEQRATLEKGAPRSGGARSDDVVLQPGERRTVTVGYMQPGWTDPGRFEPVTTPPARGLNHVGFATADRGWIGGDGGTLLRTEDGGRTWLRRRAAVPEGATPPDVVDIAFSSPEWGCLLLAVGESRMVAASADGASTWSVVDRTSAVRVHADDRGCWLPDDEEIRLLRPALEVPLALVERRVPQVSTGPPGERSRLSSVATTSEGHLVVASSSGTLRRRHPDGEWIDLPSPTRADILLVRSVGEDEVWLLNDRGWLWWSRSGGRDWTRAGTLRGEAGPLAFSSGGGVLAALPGGGLALSRDGGRHWRLETRQASRETHHDLAFLDSRRGLAGGVGPDGGGRIQITRDGGRDWRTVADGFRGAVRDVGFAGGSFAWAVGERDHPRYSTDGGESWEERSASWSNDAPTSFRDLEFVTPDDGLLLDGAGSLHTTSDGGGTWERLTIEKLDHELIDLAAVSDSGSRVLALDRSGQLQLLRFTRVEDQLAADPVGPRVPGATIAHAEGNRLWFGGPWGLQRTDSPDPGFAAWGPAERVPSQLTEADFDDLRALVSTPVASFHVDGPDTVWVAELGGGLLRLHLDKGIRTDLTPYRFYPAPWYYLAAFLSLLLLVPAVTPPPPREIRLSVAEMAVSDRPIEAGDPDPLGFRDVALGLSRFLRNTATRPPLTVAVTGEWGTGKSSLMNLLRADLKRYGFRPVWFNAWHHQKEEQLLAALLENIRNQAVPSWLRPEGWAFRTRLLGRRLRRWWLPVLLLTVVFGLLAGWLAADRDHLGMLAEVGSGLEEAARWVNPASWFEEPESESAQGSQTTLVLALLTSGAGMLFTLFRGLRAFGVKPGALITGLSERARVREAQAQTGFRYRFAREFRDVTEALQPRTLTVLIDDLDRCRPQNVLDVLEAVNFLVSSGDCFVILGVDRERVERCVGFSFRDVAEEVLDRDAPDAGPADADGAEPAEEGDGGRLRRAAFARQYLEKLINIEVPVPRTTESGGLALLKPEPREEEPPAPWQRLRDWARGLVGRWWLILALLPLALVAGLWLGGLGAYEHPESASAASPEAPRPIAPTDGATRGAASPGTSDGGADAGAAAPDTGPAVVVEVAAFHAGEAAELPHLWLWGAALLLVAGVGVWVLTTVPDVEIHDSEEFTTALERWFPLLYAERPTPRGMKRFLNRVRWYAMRQRAPRPPQSRLTALLERLGNWILRLRGGGAPEQNERPRGAPRHDSIPEEVLVALGSIQHTHPEWLTDLGFWSDPVAYLEQRHEELEEVGRTPDAERLGKLFAWIRERGLLLIAYRDQFLGLSRGIESR